MWGDEMNFVGENRRRIGWVLYLEARVRQNIYLAASRSCQDGELRGEGDLLDLRGA